MTYQEFINRLKEEDPVTPRQAAGIVGATILMRRRGSTSQADLKEVSAVASKLMKQSAFKRVMADPETEAMVKKGDGVALSVKLADYRRQQVYTREQYGRSAQQAMYDGQFLNAAMNSLNNNTSAKYGKKPAEIEKKNKSYHEMVKRMAHAQALADQGIGLSGTGAKKLVESVQKYIDGPEKVPGGKKEPAAFKESMCVLKQFMPENEFNAYCQSINQNRQVNSPSSRRYVDPQTYEPQHLMPGVKPAKEYLVDTKIQLQKGMSMDSCAKAAAIQELSGGNPNRLIRPEDLAKKTGEYMAEGSAFRKTMDDDTARGKFAELAADGKVATLGNKIIQASQNHTIRTAQWQLNQSAKILAGGKGDPQSSAKHLANVLSARDLAENAGPGVQLTNKAFRERSDAMQNDEGFMKLSAKYTGDSSFRERINDSLSADGSGMGLKIAYHNISKEAPAVEQSMSL